MYVLVDICQVVQMCAFYLALHVHTADHAHLHIQWGPQSQVFVIPCIPSKKKKAIFRD